MTETVLPTPRHSVSTSTLATFTTPTPNKLSRRMRPPDLVIKANMEDRRAANEKQPRSAKRESRLGFRNFFARHKPGTEGESLKSPKRVRPEGITEIIPQTLSVSNLDMQRIGGGALSEIHLPPLREDHNRPRTATIKSPVRAAFAVPPSPSPKRRGSLATWEPVPLFQAWPQALRSATLPACVQADHLLKMHNKKEATLNHPDLSDDKGIFADMTKKKHRRNSSSLKLDWTTKIYILVTSGYLLQYAGEGTHDRLPEKVVHLCKDSAAFASDVIPGRHWVLQVSSVFDEVAVASQDTRSLLGKFGLREKEKRQASDILMVFEAAGDMESWMTLLRKEIETLGGKRPVTETGAPKPEDDLQQQQQQWPPAQVVTARSPVIKDPNRFGRHPSTPEMHLDATFGDLLPDHHTFDDTSATNSFVSSDSRQLDGLRDSSHRLSFMSAARTIVTSDSSACNSPIRDSFGSGSQGSSSDDATAVADDTLFAPEVRLRPNATDIEDRRKSYRTSNIFLDPATSCVSHRAQETPNFSLPNATARRRAASQSSTDGKPPRRPRRPPPSALGFTRPLSIVADSPSPSKASSPRSPLDTSYTLAEYDLSSRASSRGSMRTSFQVSLQNSPRKYASMNSIHNDESPAEEEEEKKGAGEGEATREASPERASMALQFVTETSRKRSSFGLSPRSRSPIQREMAAQKRASMYSLQSAQRASLLSEHQSEEFTRGRGVSPQPQPPPRSPYRRSFMSPARGHSRHGSGSSAKTFLSNRRSLPQMPHMQRDAGGHPLLMVPCAAANGPPPAPPPNKALPPVPTGRKARSGSIPPKMGLRAVASVDGGVF